MLDDEAGDGGPGPVDNILTQRQLDVARLVAEGLTTGEIARQLDISPRTVDTHVDQIKLKLAFKRRTQIAAWVAAHGELWGQTH